MNQKYRKYQHKGPQPYRTFFDNFVRRISEQSVHGDDMTTQDHIDLKNVVRYEMDMPARNIELMMKHSSEAFETFFNAVVAKNSFEFVQKVVDDVDSYGMRESPEKVTNKQFTSILHSLQYAALYFDELIPVRKRWESVGKSMLKQVHCEACGRTT
jgi:hypothetical protein